MFLSAHGTTLFYDHSFLSNVARPHSISSAGKIELLTRPADKWTKHGRELSPPASNLITARRIKRPGQGPNWKAAIHQIRASFRRNIKIAGARRTARRGPTRPWVSGARPTETIPGRRGGPITVSFVPPGVPSNCQLSVSLANVLFST